MESHGGRSAPKVPSLRSPTVRSHCVTSPMASSHVELTQSSAWSVEQFVHPALFLFWGSVSLSSLNPLSNTGLESCSTPSPDTRVTVSPHLRSPVLRRHFCIPPFHPPLPFSCPYQLSGPVWWLQINLPLRLSSLSVNHAHCSETRDCNKSRCHQLQSINRCISQSHDALKPFIGFKTKKKKSE